MMKKHIKFFLIFFFLITFSGCERAKGFALKKILSHHASDPRWNTINLSSDQKNLLDQILSYPFTYLESGNHCYAFVSEDGRFVLKFFKQKHMSSQSLVDYLPMPAKSLFYPSKKMKRRQKEREKSFSSYKIAYEHLKKETGLFYLHLNKTNHLKKTVILLDPHGNQIPVDIDNMEFLIQRKVEVGYTHLSNLLKEGKKDDAMESIVSLLNIITHRMEKGFFDKDLQFYKNFGFIDNQAIEIDIGEFQVANKELQPKEIRQKTEEISRQLLDWIATNHYEYKTDVEIIVQDTINQIRD